MANIKITDLDAYTDPESTDVLPIVDVTNDETKKVSIANLMENAGSGGPNSPGIAFAGDNGTGMYRPGNNTLAFSTGGVKRLEIASDGEVTIPGDLTVQGTTTTIDSETLVVQDKNIELGVVDSPTDTTADGGGITLKGATDKTLNWVDSTDSWTSSENLDLASGKTYKIAGTDVLSATALGSAVTDSSLTSVGNLTGLTVAGNAILDANNAALKIKAGGIGTTGALQFTFDTDSTVYGALDLDYDARTSTGLRLYSGYPLTLETSAFNLPIVFKQGSSSESMRIASGGNVGIGAPSPNELLTLSSSGAAINVQTTRSGETYANSAIVFGSPRSGTEDGSTHGGRGLLSCLGNSSSAAGIVWLQAATASLDPQETDADLKANQCGIRLDSGGTFEHWASDAARLVIDTDGNVGISETSPDARLTVSRLGGDWTGNAPTAGTAIFAHNGNNGTESPAYLSLSSGSASVSGIYFGDEAASTIGAVLYSHSDDSLRFQTDGEEQGRFSSDGNFLVNTNAVKTIAGFTQKLQVEGTSSTTGSLAITRNSADGGGPALVLSKTRGTAVGEHGQVTAGDDLGTIVFNGGNGTNSSNQSASIVVEADETITTTSAAGRMSLRTTASGNTLPTTRLFIDSDGKTSVGSTNTYENFNVAGNIQKIGPSYTDFSDYWGGDGQNGAIFMPYGFIGSSGGFNLTIGCNGYRNDSSGFTYMDIDDNTNTACSIDLNPQGFIDIDGGTSGGTALPFIARFDGRTKNLGVNGAPNNYQVIAVTGSINQTDGATTEVFSARANLNAGSSTFVLYQARSGVLADKTVSNYRCYDANPGTNSGTITNQFGFSVQASLNQGTNNYGFFSNIASSANRWNFYANGTARNYFEGHVHVATDDINPATNQEVGICLRPEGAVIAYAASGNSGSFGRGNDGDTVLFVRAGTTVGSISVSTGATAYNTSSDYRLKENIVPLVGAVDRLKQLQVRRFNFVADPDKTVDGFVAHEAQAVVPEAITGAKDEVEAIGTLTDWDGTILETGVPEPESLTYEEEVVVTPEVDAVAEERDEDGNIITAAVERQEEVTETVTRTRTWEQTGERPVYQAIDQSKLVPLLTAALQEALAKIEALEARLDAAGL